MIHTQGIRYRPGRGGGFALVEAVISVMIVGVLMVVALNTVGAAKVGQSKVRQSSRAVLLGEALMAEILAQPYEDPEQPAGGFGLDVGEGDGTRIHFDDMDDYAGWMASPPQHKDGTPIAEADSYRRTVTVAWAEADDPNRQASVATGLKRVRVTVSHKNRELFSMVGLRAGSGADMAETEEVGG